MTELDALLQYTNYAADHLGRLNKQIQERYKQGKDAKWDLNVLQSYREIASSYDIVIEYQDWLIGILIYLETIM